jgi:2-polyprenyl-6-hydroxyphenyl methylase/3-demethylubiquinone-9 3-methyltransferase
LKLTQFYERYWLRPELSDEDDSGLAIGPRKQLLKKVLKTVPPRAPVLDAGCGSGVFSAFLHELGYTPAGIDISHNAVAYARRRYPNIPFQVAIVENGLPFSGEHFAAIWFSEVIEHVFDVHATLAELNRILQPGGTLILTTPYHGMVKNLIIALKGYDRHYNPYLSHIRFSSRNSLRMCLERAGFSVEQWRGIGRNWPVYKSQFVVCRKTGLPGVAPEIIG